MISVIIYYLSILHISTSFSELLSILITFVLRSRLHLLISRTPGSSYSFVVCDIFRKTGVPAFPSPSPLPHPWSMFSVTSFQSPWGDGVGWGGVRGGGGEVVRPCGWSCMTWRPHADYAAVTGLCISLSLIVFFWFSPVSVWGLLIVVGMISSFLFRVSFFLPLSFSFFHLFSSLVFSPLSLLPVCLYLPFPLAHNLPSSSVSPLPLYPSNFLLFIFRIFKNRTTYGQGMTADCYRVKGKGEMTGRVTGTWMRREIWQEFPRNFVMLIRLIE